MLGLTSTIIADMKTETKLLGFIATTGTVLFILAIVYGWMILDNQEQSYKGDNRLFNAIERNHEVDAKIVEAMHALKIQIQTLEYRVDSLEKLNRLEYKR